MNTVTNFVTMAESEWPAPMHFAKSFACGVAVLFVLYWIVRWLVGLLHKMADPKGQPHGVQKVAFSTTFAVFEQALFYLAAVSGREVFGFAVGGWLVLKAAAEYARWKPEKDSAIEEALAHNRYLVFVVGTGLSIAAGGVAGVAYHYCLHLLQSPSP